MTTAQDLIDNVRTDLLSGLAERRNRLAVDYVAGSDTLTLEFSTQGIDTGTRLAIGQTVYHVWSTPVSGVVSVQAGEDGSPDENHASGSVVRVNPRFTDHRILAEINNDIVALSALGLFQMKPYEFAYDAQFDSYNLPLTDFLSDYALRYETISSRVHWPYLNRELWRVERLADTTAFANALALRLFTILPTAGLTVQLLYKAPFTTLASASANLTTTGLPATAYDLPALGAQIALAAPREMKRNMGEAQPEPRRQEQIPSGGALRAYQGIAQRRERRINLELARLHEQWPARR